jgi:hypothetical protein
MLQVLLGKFQVNPPFGNVIGGNFAVPDIDTVNIGFAKA